MTGLQRYVSNELTHFVGRSKPEEEQYQLLLKIVRSGSLTHPPHNPSISGNLSINPSARLSRNEMYTPQVVCFCDIPVDDLAIHMQKFSFFGLSFLKPFLVPKGASPVFYVARESQVNFVDSDAIAERIRVAASGGSPTELNEEIRQLTLATRARADHFDSLVQKYHRLFDITRDLLLSQTYSPGVPPEHTLLHEVQMFLDFHVFSFVQFFDHTVPEDDPDNIYMEREWRVVGNILFSLDDINRLIVPRAYGRRLRDDLPGYAGQVTFVG